MREVGETQNTLSEKLDMTQGGLQHWLAGTRQPSLDEITNIADLLSCSPAWLLLGMAEEDQISGLTEVAHTALRRLIGAERAKPLPASFWTAVSAMVQTVAPSEIDETAGGAETPTSHTAPRNGTHG